MIDIIKKVFGTSHEREIKRLRPRVARINDLEPAWQKLSDAQLRAKTTEFRTKLDNGAKIDDVLEEAFATVREASRRVVHMRRRAAIPRRIPVAQRNDRVVIKLATERKHLSNLLKMVAYQAESDLVRLLAPHYRRADDEGRTLVQTALASAADIRVTAGELRIPLAPLSSPHRTAAAAALCRELDQRAVCFPGSRLRLRYAIAEVA